MDKAPQRSQISLNTVNVVVFSTAVQELFDETLKCGNESSVHADFYSCLSLDH